MQETSWGSMASIIFAGYVLTEQVSMTKAPDFMRGATCSNTVLNALIVTQKKMTSQASTSSSVALETPSGTAVAVLPYPYTVCPCFCSKAAQKYPNRPNPYTPIVMVVLYLKASFTASKPTLRGKDAQSVLLEQKVFLIFSFCAMIPL